MKLENIISFAIILLFGMTLGAITTFNIKDSHKSKIDNLENQLFKIQESNLELLRENLLIHKSK